MKESLNTLARALVTEELSQQPPPKDQSVPQFASQSGGGMKAKTIVLTLVLCFVGVAVCFADDANMGTWKLNEAKSKLAAGAPKNNTVVYEAAGDSVKVTIDGTAPDGTATHSEWTGKFDGKDYPSTGNPNEDMRSAKQI